MGNNAELVWYVCYGSNLLRDRFLCYIQGGLIPGNTRIERGAHDKSLPVTDEPYIINHELFIALSATKWEGSGVAFIDYNGSEDARTYSRRYLITREQFLDVIRQENAVPEDTAIYWDEDELREKGSVILLPDNWYGIIVYLGEEEGIPMYSFTCIPEPEKMKKNPIFGAYYDVIRDGLRETWRLSEAEIGSYLDKFR